MHASAVMGGEQAASVLATVQARRHRGQGWQPGPRTRRPRSSSPSSISSSTRRTRITPAPGLWDDGVIDPADTRRVLALAISASLNAPIPDAPIRGFPHVMYDVCSELKISYTSCAPTSRSTTALMAEAMKAGPYKHQEGRRRGRPEAAGAPGGLPRNPQVGRQAASWEGDESVDWTVPARTGVGALCWSRRSRTRLPGSRLPRTAVLVVDSSVWIDFFGGRPGAASRTTLRAPARRGRGAHRRARSGVVRGPARLSPRARIPPSPRADANA